MSTSLLINLEINAPNENGYFEEKKVRVWLAKYRGVGSNSHTWLT